MPKKTVWLIDRLAGLGFTDAEFIRIHHFSDASLAKHRNYCDGLVSPFNGMTNSDVRNRLEYIYTELESRGFTSAIPEGLFDALVRESLKRYPLEWADSVPVLESGDSSAPPETFDQPDPEASDQLQEMLDDELISAYMAGFFGYGSLSAEWWFIGVEERGGGTFAEIQNRLLKWQERGGKRLDDLMYFHTAIGEPRWFAWRELQPTWSKLIRMLLCAKRLPHDESAIRAYQVEVLGRESGETCLMALFPLPSPSTATWAYSKHSRLISLGSRDAYQREIGMKRHATLKSLIAQHKPPVVVFYGLGQLNIWKHACPSTLSFNTVEVGGQIAYIGAADGQTIVVCAHPEPEISNAYFESIGREIRRVRGSAGFRS